MRKKMNALMRLGLVPRLVLAIALGIALGGIAPASAVRATNTAVVLIDQFIKFMVPLIILGLVAPAISETGRGAGRLLLVTVALAYASTLVSGFLAFGVSALAFPHLVSPDALKISSAAAAKFLPFVEIKIPPAMDVMTALVLSFVLGLGLLTPGTEVLRRAFVDFREVVTKTIERAVVPVLPIYIFGIFLDMTAAGKTFVVMKTFAAVIAVFTLLSFAVILLQFALAGLVAKKNPLKAVATMLPAYMTALGTSSSAATIPVTRARTIANGVSPKTADFVIPLCATVHLAGSTLKIVSCAVAFMLMAGRPVEPLQFATFIILTGIVMVAAPGVPGGAIMSALGILQSVLGFDETQLALMITLYLATDSIGTACNITGDGAIALVVDRLSARWDARSGSTPETTANLTGKMKF